MGIATAVCFLLMSLLFLAHDLLSHPQCIDSSYPLTLKSPLKFCPYSGSSCCNITQDLQFQKHFQAMNISEPGCASVMKSILCARCDQFSADLFRTDSVTRRVPVLCNSTMSSNSSQTNKPNTNFCSKVWEKCSNVSVMSSPFAPSLKGQAASTVHSNQTKITEIWQSATDFCNTFGGASGENSVCFNGEPVTLNATKLPETPSGLCLEKIGDDTYIYMVPHPDGSNRAFFSNQHGKIWLATIPKQGSGGVIELDKSSLFLDLTDIVHADGQFGLMSIAVHPKFTENGRFFASFNCDKSKWADCAGRCACNSDANCDPSKLPPYLGAQPCQYQSVVSEFTIKPTTATLASRKEARRIFTMGLPFIHHGGQILFGPQGYLYLMMGDGAGSGDPYNFSQNKKSLLGKIIRLDVDNIPSASQISEQGLWGNYSIPKDNPYVQDDQLQPEIWALGFRNPWRCSFDSRRPSYFMCADVGQDMYEEVDIVTKGGNYGWRVYEGPYLYTPKTSPGGNISLDSINPIFPVMGYNHSALNSREGSASIIAGGYFYRSLTDPCMYGRYLYADLYGHAIWGGIEVPENSGNFTTSQLPFRCAADSPMQCTFTPGSSDPALGYIFSFGEDMNKDVYLLTSGGVYRVVRPSRCKYTCTKETSSTDSPSQHSMAVKSIQLTKSGLMLFLPFLLLFMLNLYNTVWK